MLAFLCLFLSLLLSVGCGKDDDENPPVSVGQPTITPTFVIKSNDTKSVTVSVIISWMTENVNKGTVDGSLISIPSGDTTITMKKGETKMLSFVVENTSGVKNYKYLTVDVPADPIPPTFSAYFTYNEQRIDTLPYLGGNIKLVVNFSNGVLELNGVKYENSPKEFDFTVTETKAYDFKVIGLGGEISTHFIVPVYEPTETESLLISGTWVITKLEGSYYTSDGPWTEFFDYIGAKFSYYMYPQKLKTEGPCYEGTCTYWFDWHLIGNGSVIALNETASLGDRKIILINSNEMISIYQSTATQNNLEVPWFVRETYVKTP